jgi:hypothetical protein
MGLRVLQLGCHIRTKALQTAPNMEFDEAIWRRRQRVLRTLKETWRAPPLRDQRPSLRAPRQQLAASLGGASRVKHGQVLGGAQLAVLVTYARVVRVHLEHSDLATKCDLLSLASRKQRFVGADVADLVAWP